MAQIQLTKGMVTSVAVVTDAVAVDTVAFWRSAGYIVKFHEANTRSDKKAREAAKAKLTALLETK